MKLAVIDIGSNAVRFQVTNVISSADGPLFKKLEYIRFPLRLGHDVFLKGSISNLEKERFKKLMQAFKLLLELYQVDDNMACATSAMREAANGHEIVEEVLTATGLKIHIIDGNREASLINSVIGSQLGNQVYLHIDVGGGSTEINLYDNRKKIDSKSFRIGSVRSLEKSDSTLTWEAMEKWVKRNTKKVKRPLLAVGTGGNINKVFDLSKKKPGTPLGLKKIKEIQSMIAGYDFDERLKILQLNPDRADVIIPAIDIYTSIMKWGKCGKMLVPDAGLKDGMIRYLYEKNVRQEKIEFN